MPGAVPAALIGLNVIGITAIAGFGARYAVALNRAPFWGLMIALYPGFVISLARDTAEIVACVFLVAALLAVRLRASLLAGIALSCAVLTRETTLLAVIALAIAWILTRARRAPTSIGISPIAFAFPLAVFAIWQTHLALQWGAGDFRGIDFYVGFPLVGWSSVLARLLNSPSVMSLRECVEIVFLTAAAVSAGWALRNSRSWLHERVAWLMYAALMLVLSEQVLADEWGFLRAVSECFVLGSILVLASRSRLAGPLLAATGAVWLGIVYLVSNAL
jgi:hypothetical protein